jgi:hypothetical protein
MCCMIAELVITMNTVTCNELKITNQNMLFPEPAAQVGRQSGVAARYHGDPDARLPWTHRREPFDIQSSNTLALKNHVGGTLL